MQYQRVCLVRWNAERGSAIIEMTLLMPFILLLLMGTIDFSRIFYTALAVSHAARAGAQYGAYSNVSSQNTAGMRQAALDAAQDDIDTSSLTVTATSFCRCTVDGITLTVLATCTSACANSRQVYVQVTTSKTFQTLWNYPGIPHSV